MSKVYITTHYHQYGTDLAVFSSLRRAEEHREAVARQGWQHHYRKEAGEGPIADDYFGRMQESNHCEESFSIVHAEIDKP